MKVGEWARFFYSDIEEYFTGIGRIKKIGECDLCTIQCNSNDYVVGDIEIEKAKPNLEDLIEVGDLVEWKSFECIPNQGKTYLKNKETLDSLVYGIENVGFKITKIIPHENLNWQEVEDE